MTQPLYRLLAFMLLAVAPAAAQAQSQSQPQLRALTSRHYRIHTDLDRPFAEDLARRMDGMYDEYTRRLSEFHPPENAKMLEVYLFRKHEDYLTFTADKVKNTGGLFMPTRHLLAAFLEGQGRDALKRTLQHEAFHQFAYSAIGHDIPAWLNEGLAQLFEEGLWNGSSFWVNQVPPRRLRQLQADIAAKKLIDFRTLLGLSAQQWVTRMPNRSIGATQYTQAWAIVHFLVNATDSSGQPRYRQRLIDMLKRLHSTDESGDAFRQIFSDNIQGFQDRFIEYARPLGPTPEALFIEHLEILSDMLTELHLKGRDFTDIAGFRQFATDAHVRLQYSKSQLQWSTQENPQVYFSDLQGQLFPADRLYFEPRASAPLPDLVCRATDKLRFRVRFYRNAPREIDREVLIEPITSSVRVTPLPQAAGD